MTTGNLTIQTNSTGKLSRSSGTMYAALTKIPNTAANGKGEHGNAVDVKPINSKFKFELELTPSVTDHATTRAVKVNTRSMLGITSDGQARTSDYESSQRIMLGNGKKRFCLGGIEKTEVVRVSGGVPLLKDIPLLGWAFSTERESTKKSQIVVVADCEVVTPETQLDEASLQEIEVIRKSADETGTFNSFGYRQFGIDPER